MNIFIAGGSGVIGFPLAYALVRNGHHVWASTRSAAKSTALQATGAQAVVVDVYDREDVSAQLHAISPEIVFHQLTSLPHNLDPRRMRAEMAATNRLRTEGAQILIQAAVAAGARRFIAQSIAFAYAPGSTLASEADNLHHAAPGGFDRAVAAVEALEKTTLGTPGIEGIVLRYGHLYGPGTAYAQDGSFAAGIRTRNIPLVGKGSGQFSFIHIADAVSASVLAMERAEAGVYNLVDDAPALVRDWLPYLANRLGAPRPRRVPVWLAQMLAGPFTVYMMTGMRGASNAKARRVLAWSPQYAHWKDGFQAVFSPYH